MAGKIFVVGIGPGEYEGMTIKAKNALDMSECIIGYSVYVDLIKPLFPGREFLTTPMTKERERCVMAFEKASKGLCVSMVCSGDAGVYGMSSLMLEIGRDYKEIEIEMIPGVSAMLSGAAVLGAPLIHDFCIISLSDRLTKWSLIEKRLKSASIGDFVVVLYNPSSKGRPDYLKKACQILMEDKDENTICGIVRNIGRVGEESRILTLKELENTEVDMFTTVFIGNSQTEIIDGKMSTPRGYL